ncbi:hypothetical protein [uncultured Lamprocystis sp.]|jgi:hypothetical protein|uniref:hypothetical protein n=1 Tax=uncultured Lamprocystis sp. TaxID=543132 RepID=UPI0025DBBCC1|nr:hypothetical protein [uncultured Lamprocystis sp.]
MTGINLAQTLAIESQIRLPGSAGRLMKQIRDIEAVAPLFRDAGLVKAVRRPAVIDLSVSGVATRSAVKNALGGFIYACAGVRTDMLIAQNQISTRGSDSISELDDIDFEAQRKRLDLIEMRHGYRLAERLLSEASPSHLILLDTPLFISRDLVPQRHHKKHRGDYDKTREVIEQFWERHRPELFPWNPRGPVMASIVAERFSAIVSIARRDLRTAEGRNHLLLSDGFDEDRAARLLGLDEKLSGIGDQRFVHGILGSFTRTMAYRMTESQSRMAPEEAVAAGLIGFHYRGGRGSDIQMVQLAGEEQDWDSAALDAVAWKLMVLDMQSQRRAYPLPQVLGYEQLKALDQFAAYYRAGLSDAMRQNDIEETWLSGLDEE